MSVHDQVGAVLWIFAVFVSEGFIRAFGIGCRKPGNELPIAVFIIVTLLRVALTATVTVLLLFCLL